MYKNFLRTSTSLTMMTTLALVVGWNWPASSQPKSYEEIRLAVGMRLPHAGYTNYTKASSVQSCCCNKLVTVDYSSCVECQMVMNGKLGATDSVATHPFYCVPYQARLTEESLVSYDRQGDDGPKRLTGTRKEFRPSVPLSSPLIDSPTPKGSNPPSGGSDL